MGSGHSKLPVSKEVEDDDKSTPLDIADAENHTIGTQQPRKCKDVIWALLFICHLIAMGAATYIFVPEAAFQAYENYIPSDFGNNITSSFAYGNGNRRELRKLGYYNGEEEGGGEAYYAVAEEYDVEAYYGGEEEAENAYYADANKGEEANEEAYYTSDNGEEPEEEPYYNNDNGEEAEVAAYYSSNEEAVDTNYYDSDTKDADATDEVNQFDYMDYYAAHAPQLLQLVAIVGALAVIISALNLQILVCCAKPLVKVALVFNIVLASAFSAVAFLTGNMVGGGISAFFALVALWFACRVWSRVPFAAANMVTATSAIRANIGVTTYAYFSILVSFAWNVWWFVTVSSYVAVIYSQQEAQAQNAAEGEYIDVDPASGFIMFLFFVSYYWVYQVIKNHLHVTVAGVVGTWWFNPLEASCCCSSAVGSSWCRASTMSFGSICFGSLLVAIIQGIRDTLQAVKDADDTGIIVCIIDCCLGCIESLAEYFNQWAYVYVGVYGYGFIDAAKNVFTLFKERGWTSIIADYLVDRVLLMLSFLMGLFMGLVAVGVAVGLDISMDAEVGGPVAPFILGFVLGTGLNAVLMNVISSAVNTVIVCYAEAPADFAQNHPELAARMRYAYGQAYPDKFTQTDSPDYVMA